MVKNKKINPLTKVGIYIFAWTIYIIFSINTFAIFNITVMQFSIVLAMMGAWLYLFKGAILTTLLTIPYHYILLSFFSNDPASGSQAFNFFGILTQLILSGLIALFKSEKEKLEKLNIQLEKKVEDRTEELNEVRKYIIDNQQNEQLVLSEILLLDIKSSLSEMIADHSSLSESFRTEGLPYIKNINRLNDLLLDSIELIDNIEFIDSTHSDEKIFFPAQIRSMADKFRNNTQITIEVIFNAEPIEMKKETQQHLYRISHEAVTNAIRHAKTDHIKIIFDQLNNTYQLVVTNNGLPMTDSTTPGIGVKLMKKRIDELNGSIMYDTTRTGNTRLCCTIPISIC